MKTSTATDEPQLIAKSRCFRPDQQCYISIGKTNMYLKWLAGTTRLLRTRGNMQDVQERSSHTSRTPRAVGMMHRRRGRTKSTVVAHLSAARSCPARSQTQQVCTRRVPEDAFGLQPEKQVELEHQPASLSSFQTPESALRAPRCFSIELRCARAARCFLEQNSIFLSKNPFLGCSTTFGAPLSGCCRRSVYPLAKPWFMPSRTREPASGLVPPLDLAKLVRSFASRPPASIPGGSGGAPSAVRGGGTPVAKPPQRWRSPRKTV